MSTQLETYKIRLDETIPDVAALRDLTKKVGYLVTTAKVATVV